MVGVTDFLEGNDEPPPDILQISRECEEDQLKRLAAVKADRGADRGRCDARSPAEPTRLSRP